MLGKKIGVIFQLKETFQTSVEWFSGPICFASSSLDSACCMWGWAGPFPVELLAAHTLYLYPNPFDLLYLKLLDPWFLWVSMLSCFDLAHFCNLNQGL